MIRNKVVPLQRQNDMFMRRYTKHQMRNKLKDRYKQFREWELQPHRLAPLSEEQHECATCGTQYTGNYCPRCGQSAKIGRYSFKNAFLLFLDVWGLGNRGMFRSIRDLMLRPGYMIRDYLRGMQMAYFPPFKMYFLLFTLSLLINSGLNIKGINRLEHQDKVTIEIVDDTEKETQQADVQEEKVSPTTNRTLTKEEKKELAKEALKRIVEESPEWIQQRISWVTLFSLLLFSCPLWLLFRHCPAIPDIRLSECFVAMVYISNMLTIYSIVPSLLCFSEGAESIYDVIAMLMVTIPIKQLSGYGYWGTIWRLAIAAITLIAMLVLLFIAVALIYSYMSVYIY